MQEVQGIYEFIVNRDNNNNRPLKNCQATAFHYPPRTVMMEDEDGKPHVHGGYEYQIFVTIAKKLKLGETFISIRDNIFTKTTYILVASSMKFLCQGYAAFGEIKLGMDITLLVLLEISLIDFQMLVGLISSLIMKDHLLWTSVILTSLTMLHLW